MNRFFDSKLEKNICEIGIGEIFCTNDSDLILSTMLGSCICICLSDNVNKIYGINHFMLPGNGAIPGDTRYGANAINQLINQMTFRGARKENLQAQVFGAGEAYEKLKVATHNAIFAYRYLSQLNIPVTASDIGGCYARKVLFVCDKNEAMVKKIKKNGICNTLELLF